MPGRLSQITLALAVGLALAVAGCGDGGDEQGLARLAPPDAPLYVETVLRPQGEQAEAIDSLTEKVAGIDGAGRLLVTAFDREFADVGGEGISYAEDFEPWLGERAAFFVRSFESTDLAGGVPDFAALLSVKDTEAATAELERFAALDPEGSEERSYGGFDYVYGSEGGTAAGVVEDAFVVGTETSFKVAVDALEGESLAASAEYAERVGALAEHPLASVFLEPAAVIEAAIASEDISRHDANFVRPLLAGALAAPVAATLSADPESASLEFVSMVDDAEAIRVDDGMLDGLPAGSWLAIALPALGESLGRSLDQSANSGLPGAGSLGQTLRAHTGIDLGEDVAPWLGDVTAFLTGTNALEFAAGVIAETSDPQAPAALFAALRRLAREQLPEASAGPSPEGSEGGFSFALGGLAGIEAGVLGDRAVAAFRTTIAAALDPPERLADDQLYGVATGKLGDEFSPWLYLDLPALLAVAAQGGAGNEAGYAATLPYAEALTYAIAGSHTEDDLAVARLSVGVE